MRELFEVWIVVFVFLMFVDWVKPVLGDTLVAIFHSVVERIRGFYDR
jgi:hypothetical protein